MKQIARFRLFLIAGGLAFAALSVPLHPAQATECIPPGGLDDTLYNTSCCSGRAVPGSTWCVNPGDYGTTWYSCYQTCA
jgi:hypothetical protein